MVITQSTLHADIHEYAWHIWKTTETVPTVYEISKRMKCHKETVKRHIEALQASGDWPPVKDAVPPRKYTKDEIQRMARAALAQRGLR